jgi:hypothetical protein
MRTQDLVWRDTTNRAQPYVLNVCMQYRLGMVGGTKRTESGIRDGNRNVCGTKVGDDLPYVAPF